MRGQAGQGFSVLSPTAQSCLAHPSGLCHNSPIAAGRWQCSLRYRASFLRETAYSLTLD